MNNNYANNKPITTALLLAAGLGSRLNPLTQCVPKCLTLVNGITILERLIINLKNVGFKRLVIVTGHGEQFIKDFVGSHIGDLKIDYIFSPVYKETNNIYSLWLARNSIKEEFLLLESDIIFEETLLEKFLFPDRIALAKMQPWMQGTCVTLNDEQQVKEFYTQSIFSSKEQLYKTVNIYSISMNSWHKIVERLEEYISDGKVNDYYEVIFSDLIDDNKLSFKGVSFENKSWYEIDTLEDLANAEELFMEHCSSKIKRILLPNIPLLEEDVANEASSDQKQRAS